LKISDLALVLFALGPTALMSELHTLHTCIVYQVEFCSNCVKLHMTLKFLEWNRCIP